MLVSVGVLQDLRGHAQETRGFPRLSPRWHPLNRSGRPSPSIRIIWRNIRTATPVTSFRRTGRCRTGRRRLNQARAEFRQREKRLRYAGGRPRERGCCVHLRHSGRGDNLSIFLSGRLHPCIVARPYAILLQDEHALLRPHFGAKRTFNSLSNFGRCYPAAYAAARSRACCLPNASRRPRGVKSLDGFACDRWTWFIRAKLELNTKSH